MKKKTNIQLASRDACTGCAACASVCPTSSITMREDKEGFLQPHIDADTCINCHKCEKTCPIVSPLIIPTDFDTQAYAAINKDEAVRMRSSSGGMFHALAKWTIEQGGVVFGARFNEQWEVVHDYTETLEGIEPFMRSKYVQSRIDDTFQQAKQFLDQGRQVLFVGTPCQIGGLKSYLHKDYENLLAVDLICHGVPSPKVWQAYLKEMFDKNTLLDFNFRDKSIGWIDVQNVTATTMSSILQERQMKNAYYRGFINGLYQRAACYNCQFKTIQRISDLTIADAWGVQIFMPNMYDDKGTSLIMTHTSKAHEIIKDILNIKIEKVDVSLQPDYNISLCRCTHTKTHNRKLFFLIFNILGFKIATYLLDKYLWLNKFFYKVQRKLRKLYGKYC